MLALHAVSNKDAKPSNETGITALKTFNDPTTEFYAEQRIRHCLGYQQEMQIPHEEDMRMGLGGERKRNFIQKAYKKHLATVSIVLGHIGALFLLRQISFKLNSS
jgi:hypothetical protein